MRTYSYRMASPLKRFLAFVIEIIVSVAYVYSVINAFDNTYGEGESAAIAIGTLILINMALMTRSTTLGKLILNMKVIHRKSKSDLTFFEMLFRESVGKCIASIFFALGFIWIMIDNENRGWHDMIFGTAVVEILQEDQPHKDEHDDDFYVKG